MVSIGRMLMNEAQLYLVDEPSLGLAPKIATAVMQALWDLEVEGCSNDYRGTERNAAFRQS